MIQIRKGLFETNSSSTHTFIMCSDDEYKKLIAGELMICGYEYPNGRVDQFVSREEVYDWFWNTYYPSYKQFLYDNYDIEGVSDVNVDSVLANEDIAYTFDNFGEEYEQFDAQYTTHGGEIVHAFGYYGTDW